MSKSASKQRTITVGGEAVGLPEAAYVELQGYIDQCLDRHAISLLREQTECDHKQACDALADERNFDHEARQKFLAETNLKEAGPSMADRAADGAKLARFSKKWSKSLFKQNLSTPAQQAKLALAVLLTVASGVLFAMNMPESGRTLSNAYFYDLNTGKLFVAESSRGRPIAAPSEGPTGASGILAMVYACGSCENPANHFVGYLTMRAADAPDSAHAETDLSSAMVVRSLDNDKWVLHDSDVAVEIFDTVREKCAAGDLVQCRP